jgi:site-specific DNA recombinase
MLVALYARVSTEKQEKEETIKSQIEAVRKYAKENGHTIIKEYVDDGWSGAVLVRPELDKLRDDAKQKIWEAVVIYDPDRLSREYAYQVLLSEELEKAGVKILYVTTKTPENDEEKMFLGFKGLFAQYERAKIAERTRRGKLSKAQGGNLVTGAPPYGYNYVSKTKDRPAHYLINKVEAIVVKKIFHWVGNLGFTTRQVIKKLYDEKISPRKGKREVWNSSTLTTLLRNETYIGIAYYYRSMSVIPENPLKDEKYKKVQKTSRRMRAKSEWIPINNPKIVPVIIDKRLFEKAQRQLRTNYEMCVRNKKNEYLLAKMIYCVCGRRRAGEGPQHGKHLYYRCTDRTYSYPLPKRCLEKGINARIADKLVWQRVGGLMTQPKLLKEQADRWVGSQKKEPVNMFDSADALKEELDIIKEKEARYIKAFGAGMFDLTQLDNVTSELKLRKMVLEKKLAEQNTNHTHTEVNLPDYSQIEEFCKRASDKLSELSFEAKRAILTKVVNKIVGNQKQLMVYGYLPLELNQYVKFETSSRDSRFAKCREVYTF